MPFFLPTNLIWFICTCVVLPVSFSLDTQSYFMIKSKSTLRQRCPCTNPSLQSSCSQRILSSYSSSKVARVACKIPVPEADFMFGHTDGPDPVKCLPLPQLFVFIYICSKQDRVFVCQDQENGFSSRLGRIGNRRIISSWHLSWNINCRCY